MAEQTADSFDAIEMTERLKLHLKEWREFLVCIHPVLLWEQSYHPFIIVSIVTFVFLLICFLESSVLTTFSLLAIVAAVADYFVPIITNNVCDPNKWTPEKESIYGSICSELALSWNTFVEGYHQWNRMKTDKPKMYYIILLTILLTFAWIGNMINNLLLTYLFILFVVLFPGLKHKGIIAHHMSFISAHLNQYTKKTL